MTTRAITLGGRTFAVPPLPLRINREVFPLCRKLTASDFLAGVLESGRGVLSLSDEDLSDLAEIAFGCARAAEPELTRDAFEAMPIAPPELIDAFLVARYQTGAWVAPTPSEGGEGDAPGEDQGG